MKVLRRFCLQNFFKTNPRNITRCLSGEAAEKIRYDDKMSSWQIHSYGNMDELQLHHSRIPVISSPDDVLIKVHAASVNPIDVAMVGGYGATALNLMRQMDNVEFPLILGRDFCGEVVSKGLGAGHSVGAGERVWGVVPVHQQGSHAEYVKVNRNMISKVPSQLDPYEAAGMLYAALTAYSGLRWSADLNMNNMSGLRALVLGASGGVGNAAVQLLKAGHATVTATCSSSAIPMVEELGADSVFDYKEHDFDQKLNDGGRYDLILDCSGQGADYITSKQWEYRSYVTFTTPLLHNLDSYGLVRGGIASLADIVCRNVGNIKRGRTVKWGYFVPSQEGIQHIANLVRENKMRVIVEKVYQFFETPDAYAKVQSGHARGKVVIDVAQSS